MQPKTFHSILLVLVSCLTLGASTLRADLLTNGNFENTGGTFVNQGSGGMNLPAGSTVIPGWTVINNPALWISNSNSYGLGTPFGSFQLDLTGFQDNTAFAGVTQTIATTIGQTYRFSLSLGESDARTTYGGPMSVLASAGSSSRSFTFNSTASGNVFGNFSFDFVATSSSTSISVVGTGSGGGEYLGLDNVAVNVVPEPSTWAAALAGAGFLALVLRRRAAAR